MEGITWRFLDGPFPGKVPEGKIPGDVAGDLWVRYQDPEVKAKKLNIEINNGESTPCLPVSLKHPRIPCSSHASSPFGRDASASCGLPVDTVAFSLPI